MTNTAAIDVEPFFAVSEIHSKMALSPALACCNRSATKGFNMENTEQASTLVEEAPALTTADRCDSCGAQAYVRVQLESGELLFCRHHANENRERLEPIALDWHDETDKLLVR